MNFDEDKEQGTAIHKSGRDADEAARSFARSLTARISMRPRWAITLRRRGSRPLLFSRRIANPRRTVYGADPLGFVASQFGSKFAAWQTRGLGGERVYRHPGQIFRHTANNSVTKFFMSFNFNQLAGDVQILLGQIRNAEISVSGVTQTENLVTSSSRERGALLQLTKSPFAARRSEAISWTAATPWLSPNQQPARTPRPQAMPLKPATPWSLTMALLLLSRSWSSAALRSAREGLMRLPFLQAAKSREAETGFAQSLFTVTNMRTWTTPQREFQLHPASTIQSSSANTHDQFPVGRTYVRHAGDKSLQSYIGPVRQWLTPVPEITGERWQSPVARQRRATDSPAVSAQPRWLESGFALSPMSMTLAKRSQSLTERLQFATRLFETQRFETKPARQSGLAPMAVAEVSRNLRSAAELIRVRKEGVARSPAFAMEFAQPARQKITEEQVVKKIENREIIELVKKELKQSLRKETPLSNFTRDDYEEISELVYSSLARRLTVERERLGLR